MFSIEPICTVILYIYTLFATTLFFCCCQSNPARLKKVLHAREQFQVSTQAEEVGGDEEDVIFVVQKNVVTLCVGHFLKGLCQYPLVWTDHEIVEFCR